MQQESEQRREGDAEQLSVEDMHEDIIADCKYHRPEKRPRQANMKDSARSEVKGKKSNGPNDDIYQFAAQELISARPAKHGVYGTVDKRSLIVSQASGDWIKIIHLGPVRESLSDVVPMLKYR